MNPGGGLSTSERKHAMRNRQLKLRRQSHERQPVSDQVLARSSERLWPTCTQGASRKVQIVLASGTGSATPGRESAFGENLARPAEGGKFKLKRYQILHNCHTLPILTGTIYSEALMQLSASPLLKQSCQEVF
jgi:hypothetical protein